MPKHPMTRPLLGVLCVIGGSISIQYSVAIASELFDTIGTVGVNGLRLSIAAIVMLAIARPSVRKRSRAAWLRIIAYGTAMASMNVLFYLAVDRLPLGVAVTLEFLGPFAIAVYAARRLRWEMIFPVIGLGGVILIAHPGEGLDVLGFVFGIGAAIAFGLYTILAEKVGEHSAGLQGLALSVTVAAILLLPFSIEAAPRVAAGQWLILAASGIIGVTLAFTLDFTAVKLVSARVVATLFSIDPVIGALVGAVILGQTLALGVIVGIVLVVIAGAAVTWLAGRYKRSSHSDIVDGLL